MLIRQLGLHMERPSGCAQFMRGKELFHSIDKWTGRRFGVVNVTHQAVRMHAENKQKVRLSISQSSNDSPKPKRARENSGDDNSAEKRNKKKRAEKSK